MRQSSTWLKQTSRSPNESARARCPIWQFATSDPFRPLRAGRACCEMPMARGWMAQINICKFETPSDERVSCCVFLHLLLTKQHIIIIMRVSTSCVTWSWRDAAYDLERNAVYLSDVLERGTLWKIYFHYLHKMWKVRANVLSCVNWGENP